MNSPNGLGFGRLNHFNFLTHTMYPTRTNTFKEHQQKNMILFNFDFVCLIELTYLIHLVLFDFLNLFNFSIHVNSLDFGLLGHLFFYFLNLTKNQI